MNELFIFCILIVANAFEIRGFNRACGYTITKKRNDTTVIDNKMVLWRVGVWSEKTLGSFLSKPVYSCPTCMASLHSIIPFWFVYLSYNDFYLIGCAYYTFYVLVLVGISSIINR